MKAVILNKYGSTDYLEIVEKGRPEPKENEVLVKVLAASVNKADWHVINGNPFPIRFVTGLFKPNNLTPGADMAGIVEKVGEKVKDFKVGDEVYGDLSGSGFGAFAEYVCADEKILAQKPENFTFEEAASLPMASVTALQALKTKGNIKAGQEVLINGASGGVGSYAIQIAKAFGAGVTAVCSTSKVDIAKEFGADEVIDYKKQDFTEGDKKHDLIFDIVGNRPLSQVKKVMKPDGTFVSAAFSMGALFQNPFAKSEQKFHNLIAKPNRKDLDLIRELAQNGKIKAPIERSFSLDECAMALGQMGKGSSSGKLVITI